MQNEQYATMFRSEFREVLKVSVLEGIRSVLGDASLRVLEHHYDLLSYADNPAALHQLLSSLFKESGAVLEKIILRVFCDKLCVPYVEHNDGFDFEELVAHAVAMHISWRGE